MRATGLVFLATLAACSSAPDLTSVLSGHDIMMNRPNSTTPEAMFRMFDDGTGTVDFIHGDAGPQDIRWSMQGNVFCIDHADGVLTSFGCATMQVDGTTVTLAHTASDGVVTGSLTAR